MIELIYQFELSFIYKKTIITKFKEESLEKYRKEFQKP